MVAALAGAGNARSSNGVGSDHTDRTSGALWVIVQQHAARSRAVGSDASSPRLAIGCQAIGQLHSE